MSEGVAGDRCSPCRSTEPRRRTVTLIDPFITPILPGLSSLSGLTSTLGALDATATADESVTTLFLLLAAAAIAAVGALGVFAPWLMPKREDSSLVACGNSFAGGVLLAAGLIHLLGDADAGFQSAYPDLDYPAAYAIATAAFLAVLGLERVVPTALESGRTDVDPESAALLASGEGGGVAPYLLLLTLSIHSLIAGLTLGLSSAAGMGVLLVAILAHKGAAGFALGSTFRTAGVAARTRIPALLVFVGSTPAGVLLGGALGDFLGDDSPAEAWFKAIAAGTFLYIATLDIVREEFFPGGSRRFIRLAAATAGAGIMALVAIWM